jgi:hypothetical protein
VNIIDETRFVERFQFFNGQRLFASDLQGLEEFNREMRWLHNQSLHQPGVGNGLAVNGKREDREVTIGPGYATDSMGREIILTEKETLAIPPVAGNQGKPISFDLTVAYPDDSTLEEAEIREGICVGRGVIRLREAPVFCWVELAGEQLAPKKQKLKAELEGGLRIRLARIEVFNCRLFSDVSMAQRQNARPARMPYIVSHTDSLASLTDISLDRAGLKAITAIAAALNTTGTMDFAIQGTVDTSAAQFQTIPEYKAHLAGPRRFVLDAKVGNQVTQVVAIVLDQFQVTKQRSDGFSFLDLGLVIGSGLAGIDVVDKDGQLVNRSRIEEVVRQIREEWQVVWMGVEG